MFEKKPYETVLEQSAVSIKIFDALYTSELSFDDSIEVLNSISNTFAITKRLGITPSKEDFKRLKEELQKTIDESKKASAATLTKKNIFE